MSQKVINSQLIEFPLGNEKFYCLEELPNCPANGKSIIFLHGLGENRSGLNYLFHELSQGLTARGFSVYRFDLAGCGESSLPLSFKMWQEQLSVIKHYINKDCSTHLVARGISSLLLPKNAHAINVAIGLIEGQFFKEQYPLISLENSDETWIPKLESSPTSQREYFWYGMGVEAGCLGGFYINKKFLKEIEPFFIPLSKEHAVIYAGAMWPHVLPAHTYYMTDCHPLFFYQTDRKLLLNKLIEILSD